MLRISLPWLALPLVLASAIAGASCGSSSGSPPTTGDSGAGAGGGAGGAGGGGGTGNPFTEGGAPASCSAPAARVMALANFSGPAGYRAIQRLAWGGGALYAFTIRREAQVGGPAPAEIHRVAIDGTGETLVQPEATLTAVELSEKIEVGAHRMAFTSSPVGHSDRQLLYVLDLDRPSDPLRVFSPANLTDAGTPADALTVGAFAMRGDSDVFVAWGPLAGPYDIDRVSLDKGAVTKLVARGDVRGMFADATAFGTFEEGNLFTLDGFRFENDTDVHPFKPIDVTQPWNTMPVGNDDDSFYYFDSDTLATMSLKDGSLRKVAVTNPYKSGPGKPGGAPNQFVRIGDEIYILGSDNLGRFDRTGATPPAMIQRAHPGNSFFFAFTTDGCRIYIGQKPGADFEIWSYPRDFASDAPDGG